MHQGKQSFILLKKAIVRTEPFERLKIMESMGKLASSSNCFYSDTSEKTASFSSLSTDINGDYFEERRGYFRSQRSIRISSINLNVEH